jgi:hypothetical protein
MARKEIHAAGQRTRRGMVRALCGLSVARKDTGRGARVNCSLCLVVTSRAESDAANGGGRR